MGRSQNQETEIDQQINLRTTKLFFQPTMAEGGEDIDLVEDIIITPFSRQTFQEKLDIVRRGRPTLTLQSLSQAGKGFVRHFQSSNYERYQWLTGSEKHCKLYCWECLLFASDRFGVWSHTGFANLSCLTKAAMRHGWALTSNGAFENFWGHPSGSTAQRTSAQGNEAAQ